MHTYGTSKIHAQEKRPEMLASSQVDPKAEDIPCQLLKVLHSNLQRQGEVAVFSHAKFSTKDHKAYTETRKRAYSKEQNKSPKTILE